MEWASARAIIQYWANNLVAMQWLFIPPSVGFVEVRFWEEIRIVPLVSTLRQNSGVRGFFMVRWVWRLMSSTKVLTHRSNK
jgi:hypothetical protein